jgi:hypothetical protein
MNTDDRITARLKLVDEHVRQVNEHDLAGIMRISARQRVSTTSRGMPNTKVAMTSNRFTRGCYGHSRGYTSTFGDVTLPLTPSSLMSSFEAGTSGPWQGLPPTGRHIELPLRGIFTFDDEDRPQRFGAALGGTKSKILRAVPRAGTATSAS